MIDLNVVKDLAEIATGQKSLIIPQANRTYLFIRQKDGAVKKEEIPALHELPLPSFIAQKLELEERESFTRYVKQYKNASSKIFGKTDLEGASFVCVLDYHEQGAERKPDRTKHIVTFDPDYSPEFAAWLSINRKGISQDEFLEHLRRWGYVVTNFSDADMVEMFSNLEFSTKGNFSSMVERTKGGRSLIFNEEVEGNANAKTKKIAVPDALKIKSEIFMGGAQFEYEADILYRVQHGSLKVAIELKRSHVVIRDAIKSLITDIEAETTLEVLIGAPELS